MHDPHALLDLGPAAVTDLARRGYRLDLDRLRDLVAGRASGLDQIGKLRAESNRLAREGRSADAGARDRARELKGHILSAEAETRRLDEELTDLLLRIPNRAADGVPDGNTEDDAIEVRRVGAPKSYPFPVAHHVDLAESMNILDLRAAGKLAGARFRVTRGAGAALERALGAFLLDQHVREHGYVEYGVPTLVSRETMTGTGQLPKFADDLFVTSAAGRDLYLIPTAEVPLTNLFAGESIDPGALPIAVTAQTPCFRSEAGSYGRDTRGIMRLHEFSKVELVRICAPEQAGAQLDILVGQAEECLKRLGLAYRVVLLAAGDMGFSARKTYDIEVWLPSQERYREISSCSDCGTFQARRAKIRIRGRSGADAYAATLNGSALPIGRTMVAILEQYQRADGGVDMPGALRPWLGFTGIGPDGSPER